MFISRNKVIGLLIVCVIIISAFFVYLKFNKNVPEEIIVPSPSVEEISVQPKYKIIGKSFEGRSIESFTFGEGKTHLLFIGGIHGGYEWNSIILAYQFIDYLNQNPAIVPKNLSISIIPNANPDGAYKFIGKEGRFSIVDIPQEKNTTGLGRFNARNVDLNRNFDCRWSADTTWRENKVGAGTAPFSEPESQAIRDFVLVEKPTAVISWHSQSNTVYAGECGTGIIPETMEIMNLYAQSSGYQTATTFDAYVITGDMEGWLTTIGIPSITVELKTHETIEWEQNLAGIKSLINYYSVK